MTLGNIVSAILMWPAAVYKDLMPGTGGTRYVAAAAVGVGVPLYFYGIPSAEMTGMELAQWYLVTGAAVYAADQTIGAGSASSVVSKSY